MPVMCPSNDARKLKSGFPIYVSCHAPEAAENVHAVLARFIAGGLRCGARAEAAGRHTGRRDTRDFARKRSIGKDRPTKLASSTKPGKQSPDGATRRAAREAAAWRRYACHRFGRRHSASPEI